MVEPCIDLTEAQNVFIDPLQLCHFSVLFPLQHLPAEFAGVPVQPRFNAFFIVTAND